MFRASFLVLCLVILSPSSFSHPLEKLPSSHRVKRFFFFSKTTTEKPIIDSHSRIFHVPQGSDLFLEVTHDPNFLIKEVPSDRFQHLKNVMEAFSNAIKARQLVSNRVEQLKNVVNTFSKEVNNKKPENHHVDVLQPMGLGYLLPNGGMLYPLQPDFQNFQEPTFTPPMDKIFSEIAPENFEKIISQPMRPSFLLPNGGLLYPLNFPEPSMTEPSINKIFTEIPHDSFKKIVKSTMKVDVAMTDDAEKISTTTEIGTTTSMTEEDVEDHTDTTWEETVVDETTEMVTTEEPVEILSTTMGLRRKRSTEPRNLSWEPDGDAYATESPKSSFENW